MGALEIAQSYFDAWNRRDVAGIVATFRQDGTYIDPATGESLSGPAIGNYATSLFQTFPDLSFDIVSSAPAGDSRVAAQWLMKGTNSGPVAGGPPTGKTVALPGADFITVEGDKIRSVQGYFDQKAFLEQLGLQVLAQPYSRGPVSFGYSANMLIGKQNQPGAISLTSLQLRSAEEADVLRSYSQRIMGELPQTPGFISMMAAGIGHRFYTATAWENAEAPKQLLRGGAHREAMERFFGQDFAAGGVTTVWAPERINAMWVRCESCSQMADYHRNQGKCRCGATLPQHPPYW